MEGKVKLTMVAGELSFRGQVRGRPRNLLTLLMVRADERAEAFEEAQERCFVQSAQGGAAFTGNLRCESQ